MKNKYLYLICLLVFVVMVGLIIALTVKKDNPEEPIITEYKLHKDFIIYERNQEDIKLDSQVFSNYNDYYDVTKSNLLTEKDFENNNYFLLSINVMGCREYDVLPTDYSINDGTINVTVKYKTRCGLCAPEYNYYLLKIDKSIEKLNLVRNDILVSSEECDNNVVYKPLIYLYPKYEMDVNVVLSNSNNITTSYPKYINGWNVKAYPNGKLIDNNTNRELYGLYWEGKNYKPKFSNEGCVVKGKNTIKYLENKLSILGINERESNEFIIYYLPKLESNKYNYIRFESEEFINNYMPLEITPKPDTIIRVYMTYMPLENIININEQKLNRVERTGFTVVEWGGTKITY